MIRPLENMYGNSKITMKAVDESQYGSDNYEWEVEVDLDITVNPVNDAPVLKSISDFTKAGAGAVNQDDIWSFTFNASDVDNPVLMYTTDIEDVFTIGGEDVLTTDPQDYGYSFDAFTGEIKLTPSNDFVGIHTINVTVADNDLTNPKYDYDVFQIEILNVNDPPTIKAVGNKDVIPGTALVFNTKQNKKLELQVIAEDPDIDIGESDTLKFKIDDERDNLYIDELKGELYFRPNQNDVDNRTTYITITVTDSKKAEDTAEIRVKVDNVNDPPRADGIEIIIDDADLETPQLENLTIKLKVMNPVDPDGDAMSYALDFDTSENLDLIGGADDDNELQGLENIVHRYPHQGTFNGMLTIRDAVGATVKVSFNVTVLEPKTLAPTVKPPTDDEPEPGIAGLGQAGGVDVALWIILLVVIIVITMLAVMFMIRKKKGEIEKMRHTERFRQETDGEPEMEVAGGLPGMGEQPAFPEEKHQARSASELYSSDSGGSMPSLFDMPQQQQPMGLPPQPQQPAPLGLPPAAAPVQPGAQPGMAQPEQQQPAATGDMKCTSCGTPINADWYICPGCHRFLK
jgi:hypothetical protein